MNSDGDNRDELEQPKQDILTREEREILAPEISDEALEAAAGTLAIPASQKDLLPLA